jgi:hypothetical protein
MLFALLLPVNALDIAVEALSAIRLRLTSGHNRCSCIISRIRIQPSRAVRARTSKTTFY